MFTINRLILNMLTRISVVFICALMFSSCSMTKMRYSNGYNLGFLQRGIETGNSSISTGHKSKRAPIVQMHAIQESNQVQQSVVANPLPETPTAIDSGSKIETSLQKKENQPLKQVRKYAEVASQGILKGKGNQPTNQEQSLRSGIFGTLGLTFAILALITGLFGSILVLLFWPLGLVFCIIGMSSYRANRSIAIAGLVLLLVLMFLFILLLSFFLVLFA